MASNYTPITLSDDQKAELEQQYGKIAVFRADDGSALVIKRPDRGQARGYKHAAKTSPDTANEDFIRRVAVFPPKEQLDSLFDEWPFLCDGIAASPGFQKFIGLSVTEDLKS